MRGLGHARSWCRLPLAALLPLLAATAVPAGAAVELEALCDGVVAGNVWDSDGTGTTRKMTFYYAEGRDGYHPVGVAADRKDRGSQFTGLCLVKDLTGRALAAPVDYARVWWDRKSGATRDVTVWSPVCSPGYLPVGVMVQASYRKPPLDAVRCVREELTVPGEADGEFIYIDAGSRAIEDLGVWRVKAAGGRDLGAVFVARKQSPPALAEGRIRLIRDSAIR